MVGKLIPAPVVAAASAALLFASKGGFSPELQLFTRGATAAFKRLAVILLEDAWIEEDNMASSLEGLLALGLVTQQMNDYEPSHHLIISSMRIAAKAAMSCSLIAWRKGKQGPSSIKATNRIAWVQYMLFGSQFEELKDRCDEFFFKTNLSAGARM